MSDNKRAELVQAIRSGWPAHGSTNYQNRGYAEVPPVSDGGMTARLIDYAVDTAIAKLTPRTITTAEELIDAEDPETILKDKFGQPHQWGIDVNGDEGWMSPQDHRVTKSRTLWRSAPITVLHEPAQ